MKSYELALMLKGFFDIAKPISINTEQTDTLRKYVSLVFDDDVHPKPDKPHPAPINPKNTTNIQ